AIAGIQPAADSSESFRSSQASIPTGHAAFLLPSDSLDPTLPSSPLLLVVFVACHSHHDHLPRLHRVCHRRGLADARARGLLAPRAELDRPLRQIIGSRLARSQFGLSECCALDAVDSSTNPSPSASRPGAV